jgi:hypothetical protein
VASFDDGTLMQAIARSAQTGGAWISPAAL